MKVRTSSTSVKIQEFHDRRDPSCCSFISKPICLLSTFTSSLTLVITNMFSISIILSFQGCYIYNSTIRRQKHFNGQGISTAISPKKIYKLARSTKKCSPSLVIREMHIKTTMRHHFRPMMIIFLLI